MVATPNPNHVRYRQMSPPGAGQYEVLYKDLVIGSVGLRKLTTALRGVADSLAREINPVCLTAAEWRENLAREGLPPRPAPAVSADESAGGDETGPSDTSTGVPGIDTSTMQASPPPTPNPSVPVLRKNAIR